MILKSLNLKKSFYQEEREVEIIKGITIEIKEGDFIAITGNSGSGKTTFLYLLSGLIPPSSGKILLNDFDLNELKDEELSQIRQNEIGFIFQNYNLISSFNVEENIIAPLLLANKSDYNLQEVLNLVGLSGFEKRNVNTLSGGEKQRVAIARACLMKPKVIFADEPTGNLDSQRALEIVQLFKKINQEYNITIIMVTHSNEIASYAKKIIVMRDGLICD